MTSFTFARIFFALAMTLMANPKTTKITVTADPGTAMTFTLKPDGKWHCMLTSATPPRDGGDLVFDKDKQTVTQISAPDPSLPGGPASDTKPIAALAKFSAEKPDPKTVTIFDVTFDIARAAGGDITLTPQPAPQVVHDSPPRTITIHYEEAPAPAK